ncbi:DUF5602 domain-containing protein [Rufibacter tibetensis]|uniref:TTHB210-like domain-containing protein n=1 Tax=Rufibacter tibetensis TaxID=512763 RepID=A0A0P0BZ84_9BACT|nr:DUF5602 domain-containing protein [Rufibacter tibetensis]ALI97772.1 hypothetical protein DC20_00650 [Rufibacter tibetensis]
MKTNFLFTKAVLWCSALACLSLFTTCSDDDDEELAGTFYGPIVALTQGNVRTWVTTNDVGVPVSLGVTFSEQAVKGNLGNAMRMYILDLPEQAEQTLYDHVMLDWNPQGHDPAPLYGVPHFDLHFYMISPEEVAEIKGQAAMDEMPASQFRPQNYVLTPGVVPAMGAHWVDISDVNNSPGNFAKTFIYGSVDGNFIFHEPMFTLAYLNTLPTVGTQTIPIPQPTQYQVPGLYPQRYSYSYNASTKEYTISLLDLTQK